MYAKGKNRYTSDFELRGNVASKDNKTTTDNKELCFGQIFFEARPRVSLCDVVDSDAHDNKDTNQEIFVKVDEPELKSLTDNGSCSSDNVN